MNVKPIVVIPHGTMSPEEFGQSKYRLEAAGYVVIRCQRVLVTDPIYVAGMGNADQRAAAPNEALPERPRGPAAIIDAAMIYVRAHRQMIARGDSASIFDAAAAHGVLVSAVPE